MSKLKIAKRINDQLGIRNRPLVHSVIKQLVENIEKDLLEGKDFTIYGIATFSTYIKKGRQYSDNITSLSSPETKNRVIKDKDKHYPKIRFHGKFIDKVKSKKIYFGNE